MSELAGFRVAVLTVSTSRAAGSGAEDASGEALVARAEDMGGEVIVHETTDAIAVPPDSIREDRDGEYVLVIEDDTAMRRAVLTGETWRGRLVQIIEGLEAGDTVITAALPEIAPGDAVELVE